MNMHELADEIGKMNPDQLIELATIIAEKAKQPASNPEPTIYERFPVGSYVCGLEVVNHDGNSKIYPTQLSRKELSCWVGKELLLPLVACHDWILKYHPVIEAAREWSIATSHSNSSNFGSIYAKFACQLEKTELWKNTKPVKLPWEDKA